MMTSFRPKIYVDRRTLRLKSTFDGPARPPAHLPRRGLPPARPPAGLDIVERLLAEGADVHGDDDGALRSACAGGDLPVVNRLLAAGANVHARRDCPLRKASKQGRLPVVERLLEAGADVHAKNDWALIRASEYDHLPVVDRLLAAGADMHANADAALHLAGALGHGPIIERLLVAGADPTAVAAPWCGLPAVTLARVVLAVPPRHFHGLPDLVQAVWVRYHTRIKRRLCRCLQRARDRLDQPPRVPLGGVWERRRGIG